MSGPGSGAARAGYPPRPMAAFVELHCPSCTAFIARLRRSRVAVGSPFEQCARCGALVSRPSVNEWDLLGAGAKAYWLADAVGPFVALGLVPALAYLIAGPLAQGTRDPRVLLALALGGPLILGSLRALGVLQVIQRSRRRMGDPMYRARLVEYGRRARPPEKPKNPAG